MPTKIRKATIEDADALTAVQIASWRATYRGLVPDPYLEHLDQVISAEKWAERLASPDFVVLVAEDATAEPKLVGFSCGGPIREPVEAYEAELYAIYLLAAEKRKGIGRALTAKLSASLRERGFRSMLAWVLVQNPAVSFYERIGAVRVTEKPIEIGGAELIEVAFGWTDLERLTGMIPSSWL